MNEAFISSEEAGHVPQSSFSCPESKVVQTNTDLDAEAYFPIHTFCTFASGTFEHLFLSPSVRIVVLRCCAAPLGLAADGHHCILTKLPLAVARIDKAAFHTLRSEMRSKHTLPSLMDQLCVCAGVCGVCVYVCVRVFGEEEEITLTQIKRHAQGSDGEVCYPSAN